MHRAVEGAEGRRARCGVRSKALLGSCGIRLLCAFGCFWLLAFRRIVSGCFSLLIILIPPFPLSVLE